MREQRRDDVVGVDRLGQVVDRAELHRVHRGGDVAVAGEDDAARVRAPALERGYHVEPVAVAEPHVDDGESGRRFLDLQQAVGDRFGGRDGKAALFERLGEPLQERMVVFDDQQAIVRRECSVSPLGWRSSSARRPRYHLRGEPWRMLLRPAHHHTATNSDYRRPAQAATSVNGRSKSLRLQRSRTIAPCSGAADFGTKASRRTVPARSWQ